MKKIVFAVLLAGLIGNASATISWIGGAGTDIFDESNWDLSGSSVVSLEPNVSIADDVTIGPGPFTNNPVIPDLTGQQRFQLDDGRMLTVSGSTVSVGVANNDGVGGAPGAANGPVVSILEGAAFNPFFVVNDVKVQINAFSTATFGGGGNPINLSTVDLQPDSMLAFLSETPEAYRTEHLSKTTVNGVAAVEGVNILIESDGAAGSIVTVIPEPSAAFLAALAGMVLMLARRRRSA